MKYGKQTFEQYLMDFHSKCYPEILDDDLPDAYNDWISNRDVDKIMEDAELYGKQQYVAGQEDEFDIINKIMKK